MARGVRLVVAAAVMIVAPGIAECRQYGRWTWDAVFGLEGRSNDNFSGEHKLSGYRTRSLFVGLGVNGFIIHPTVARFRLGLDTWLTQFPDGAAQDNFRIGGRFDLGLFERSAFPVRLYFARSQYDYQDLADDDPVTLLGGLPDTATSWGGRLRVRRGVLAGLLLGLDSTTLDFLGTDSRTETSDRYFGDWSRSGKKIQHHVRLVHENRDYSRLDYAFDTTTLTWDEHGPVSLDWRWDLSAVGIRRTTLYRSADQLGSDTVRLRNRFIRNLKNQGSLDLSYGFGYASSSSTQEGSAMDHQLEVRYRRLLGTGWEISPFGVVTRRDLADGDLSALQGGLSATWSGSSGAWDGTFSGQGAYGHSRFSFAEASGSQPFWSSSLAYILGHGTPDGLRKELEVGFSRNEIKSVGDGLADLPDLGIGFAVAGAQDSARARFSLFHNFSEGEVSGWGEWRRREADSLFDDTRIRVEDLLVTAQFRRRRVSVVFNGGTTEIDDFRLVGQEIDYFGVAVTWSPWRFLHASASFRKDFRRLALTPDLDSDRMQGIVEFRMGRLSLRGEIFQYTERNDGGPSRRNRGIFWSVRRGFFGLLPIVTGPQRRGVIR